MALPFQVAAHDDAVANEKIRLLERQVQALEERLRRLEGGAAAVVQPAPVLPEAEQPQVAQAATDAPPADPAEVVASNVVTQAIADGDIKESHQLLTRDALLSNDFPGSWPMFGTDLRMKVGGYIKTDFVADFDGTRDPTQFLMRTIPARGQADYGDDGYTDFFAKETRFNLDVRRVVPGSVPLRGFIEGDFFSDGEQFRLRHAYVSAGDYIIGKTWTTLSFLESLPFMIDFAAGDALFGGRAAQVRYQTELNDQWKMSLAVEDMPFLGIENAFDLPGKATKKMPVLAARADYHWDSGLLLLGASASELNWDGGSAGPSDSALQYALIVGGRQNIGSRTFVTWNATYTDGAGENIMAFAGTGANAVLGPDGKLDTIPALAVVLGGGYDWTSTLSSNASFAYGWLDTPDTRDPESLKRGGIAHLNLVWRPAKHISTGAELMWGKTRLQNDAAGDAARMQFMAKFEF
ncbi:hypothetical protein E2F43_14700 [Seongchinamella unica]|uniref:Porin n=1 Tax=Seongchinamella unica TaxID=2547392 RepID=A0A4R5LQK9_9GAMM|nr:DcaP family trimeric outer membrane transporter [Seongchinamella unica]TDG12809.1 hypothetical protein E2F43_14700 [Seongchinamella unica]